MLRNNLFLRSKEEKEELSDRFIFLDINGVIQPTWDFQDQERFRHDLDKLINYLSDKYNDDIYKSINKWDVAACFYDWDYSAVGILKTLFEDLKTNVIISSDWRKSNDLNMLKAIFKLYDMDDYIVDKCKGNYNDCSYLNKKDAINEYITSHNLNNYIVLDDSNFLENFGYRFRKTKNIINNNDSKYIRLVLSNNINITKEDNNYLLKINDKISAVIKEYDYNNIKYLDILKIDLYRSDFKEYIEYFLNYIYVNDAFDALILDLSNYKINELNTIGHMDNNNLYTVNKNNVSVDIVKGKILSKKR